MKNKGFIDLGLGIVFVWIAMIGAIAIHETTKDESAKELCQKQGKIQVGSSLYECKKLQTLGEFKKPVIIEKPCPKCPKPKVVQKPCGDDRKIFPLCSQASK